jgi:hypothetical protein
MDATHLQRRLQFHRCTSQREFEPCISISLHLAQHFIPNLVTVRDLQSDTSSIRVELINRIALKKKNSELMFVTQKVCHGPRQCIHSHKSVEAM